MPRLLARGEAEIAPRRDQSDSGPRRTDPRHRVVSGGVVDDENLVRGCRRRGGRATERAVDVARRVVGDDDDRDARGSGRHFAQASSTCNVRCAHSSHE